MSNNIFAYTSTEFVYPQFLSVNLEDNGRVAITSRSPAWGDGTCGDTATVVLTSEELQKLANTLYSFACTGKA